MQCQGTPKLKTVRPPLPEAAPASCREKRVGCLPYCLVTLEEGVSKLASSLEGASIHLGISRAWESLSHDPSLARCSCRDLGCGLLQGEGEEAPSLLQPLPLINSLVTFLVPRGVEGLEARTGT